MLPHIILGAMLYVSICYYWECDLCVSMYIVCVCVGICECDLVFGRLDPLRVHVSPSDPRACFALVPSGRMDSIKVQFHRESGRMVWSEGEFLSPRGMKWDSVSLKMLQGICQKTVCELEL